MDKTECTLWDMIGKRFSWTSKRELLLYDRLVSIDTCLAWAGHLSKKSALHVEHVSCSSPAGAPVATTQSSISIKFTTCPLQSQCVGHPQEQSFSIIGSFHQASRSRADRLHPQSRLAKPVKCLAFALRSLSGAWTKSMRTYTNIYIYMCVCVCI